MTLTQKTITGIIWNFAEQIGHNGIGVVITLLLTRFLIPADYSFVAMMALFLAVTTTLLNSSFKQTLIFLQGMEQVDFNVAGGPSMIYGIIN